MRWGWFIHSAAVAVGVAVSPSPPAACSAPSRWLNGSTYAGEAFRQSAAQSAAECCNFCTPHPGWGDIGSWDWDSVSGTCRCKRPEGGPARASAGHVAGLGVEYICPPPAPTLPPAPPPPSPLPGAVTAGTLGVVVNTNDPYSTAVAAYYAAARGIPAQNIINVTFKIQPEMQATDFGKLKTELDAKTPSHVQAYALTWVTPYRVEGMSMTSAVALGYNVSWNHICADGCCNTTNKDPLSCCLSQPSPYYDSDSAAPFSDFRIRPAMALATRSIALTKKLIDTGVASDGSYPYAQPGYLIRSHDKARSARWCEFLTAASTYGDGHPLANLTYVDSTRQGEQFVSGARNVMFYFESLSHVPNVTTNTFAPGAVVDTLTSGGGSHIDQAGCDSGQQSCLCYLEHGATASYGSTVEPCAWTQKFPNPTVLLKHYLAGQTVLESYWKSVLMPGLGLFVGEPLARPFGTAPPPSA